MRKRDKIKNITEVNLRLENYSTKIVSFVKEEVDPRKVKVPGLDTNDAGTRAGRADFLINSVKKSLRSLGIDPDDLDKQKTIEQLKVAPFGFIFSLIWPKENVWGEKEYVTISKDGKEIDLSRIDTRAKIKNENYNGGIILSTKMGLDIAFIEQKELERTLGDGNAKLPPGKDGFNLKRLLEEGVIYKVKIDPSDVVIGSESEETIDSQTDDNVPVPEEVASGKNRNEIFRLLLKNFGGYEGAVVYGDGFDSAEKVKEYGKIQRAVKSGKLDKAELKKFRENINRDSYSMMISNLRKSFPNTFLSKLSKAFPEFEIKFNKESVDESFDLNDILTEEEKSSKYKRWDIVFPNKVVGGKTVDSLDKNIREFMASVKKWFAVPVVAPDGKKRSYNISYNKDVVNNYWSNYYGSKKESTLSMGNILLEIIKEETRSIDSKTKNYPDYFLLKIENGGLQTVDEGRDDIESRKSGKGKQGGFVDAVVVDLGKEFIGTEKEIKGSFKIRPGYTNAINKKIINNPLDVDLDIIISGGKVTGGEIKIKDEVDISKLLNEIIKKGGMKYKRSEQNKKEIVFYYNSQLPISQRINNIWMENN
jgi:hypothetical protein